MVEETNKSLVEVNDKKSKHIQSFLVDTYDDKFCDLHTKKAKIDYEKYKMENIKNTAIESPIFGHYVSKMMLYKMQINDLKDEKAKLESKKDGDMDIINKIYNINEVEIPKLNEKMSEHRKSFYRFIEREKLDINEDDINDIVNRKNIKLYEDNEVNVNETINAQMEEKNALMDENDQEINRLTNKILSIKNVKWFQVVKKFQMKEEYKFFTKSKLDD